MSKAFNAAVRLLARREHTLHELTEKLAQKRYAASEITAALSECQRLGLQSDERFVEQLIRARMRQGYGPRRIEQELQSKKVDQALIAGLLDRDDEEWFARAMAVWVKKYRESNVNDEILEDADHSTSESGRSSNRLQPLAIQKQKQFLLYRGFSMTTINKVLDALK